MTLALGMFAVCGGRLPAQCTEVQPPDQPGSTDDSAVCTPYTHWRYGLPIVLNTRWKGGPPLGVRVPIDTGICFQADADDRDLHVVECRNDGSIFADRPMTAELINYTYWIQWSELPLGGEWRGLGMATQGPWQFPSAKYHIHLDTPAGTYRFSVACMIDDEAAEKDDAPVFWTLDVRVTITPECELILEGFENEQVITTPQTDGPFTGSNCCLPDAGFWPGPSIKPLLPCEGIVPRFVESEQYDMFGSLFMDIDYLYRSCDDTSQCPIPLNRENKKYDSNLDSLHYEWGLTNLLLPNELGQFVLQKAPETVLWKAPQLGMMRVCLRVTDRGHQAFDQMVIRELDQIVLVGPPGVVEGQGVMDPAPIGGATKLKCAGLRMWRNCDDDDQNGTADTNAPPLGDNDLGWVKLGMASSFQFTIDDPTNPTPLPRVRLYYQTGSGYVFVPSGTIVNAGSLFADKIFVEGISPSTAVNDIKLKIVRKFDAGGPCDLVVPDKEYEVPITVFAVRSVDFVAGDAGAGEARSWGAIPAHEVPSGIRGLTPLNERFYVEPGARLGQDAPDAGGDPNHPKWNRSTRDHVKVRATIRPAVAGLQVRLAGFDVDDHLIDTTGHSNTNFVDDETDTSMAGEEDNSGLMVDGAGAIQRHKSGRMAHDLGGSQSDSVSGNTDANGRFEAYFVATLTPGDNFRVLASLVPAYVQSSEIMAPNSARLAANNPLRHRGMLFYRAPAPTAPVVIEETSAAGADAPVVQSRELTVRRVIYLAERRYGTHHVTLNQGGLLNTTINRDRERETHGVLRLASRLSDTRVETIPRSMLPASAATYLQNLANGIRRDGGDVRTRYKNNEFADGRVEMLAKNVGNSEFARVVTSAWRYANLVANEPNAGFYYRWGSANHRLVEMFSRYTRAGFAGKWVLIRTNVAPPNPWPAGNLDVGGQQFTVHHVLGTGPFEYLCKARHGMAGLDDTAFVPVVFKSDDFRFGFETPNHTMTPSPLDVTVPGGQPTHLLANKLFAEQCVRVARIGNIEELPFAFIPQRSEHTRRFQGFNGGYPVGAKSWAIYLDHYAHAYLDSDGDPDRQGTTFAWASGGLMGGGRYLQILQSNEPSWDWLDHSGHGPGTPYTFHGYGAGLTRATMHRVRVLVHEVCHHLLPSCPDRAPYTGLRGDEHNLPGLMNNIWKQDPLLGNQWVEHTHVLHRGDHLESLPGPYVTWYLRKQLDWLQKAR